MRDYGRRDGESSLATGAHSTVRRGSAQCRFCRWEEQQAEFEQQLGGSLLGSPHGTAVGGSSRIAIGKWQREANEIGKRPSHNVVVYSPA